MLLLQPSFQEVDLGTREARWGERHVESDSVQTTKLMTEIKANGETIPETVNWIQIGLKV